MRFLVDTNVLVYLVSPAEGAKHLRARRLLEELGSLGNAALPSQALAELASVSLRKLGHEPARVFGHVEALEAAFPVIPLTAPVVLEAVRGVKEHQMSYYDAQIWAAARLAQIPVILTEDFQHGAIVDGVSFENPFATSASSR